MQAPNPRILRQSRRVPLEGIGARYSCGTVSCAPERNPRSGAWRKSGAVRHIAGSSGDTRNTGDIGIRFEIALNDEIALKEMTQISTASRRLTSQATPGVRIRFRSRGVSGRPGGGPETGPAPL
jgi:hypothetical protein